MQDRDWWRGAAIYQIYLQSFYDSNDDGTGDIPGLVAHLDYVAALGVDAIWITPFYPSPLTDSGYDVADYRSVDPRYGTLGDFDALVTRAHALDLKVIIDQVWSHTAATHPWFLESRASRINDKADWYVWSDPAADGSAPNNWLSVFGGSAWGWAPERQQYYLHHFLPSQPKLNLRDVRVLEAHFANARFWLEHGVDGFRLDAVDFMLHDDALRNNPPAGMREGQRPWNPFRLQGHLHDMCQPANQELMSRIRDFTDRFPGTVAIGEISSEVGALDRIAKMTGSTRLHMAYTLGVMKSDFSPLTIRAAIGEAAVLNRTGWLCWAFSNHDVERAASRWNPGGIDPAAFVRLELALLCCLPGSICLFQGEELGLPQARVPFASIRDAFGRAFYPVYAGRDGARTPMPWVMGARHSGFSSAERTWLPVARSHDALAIDQQERDRNSTLACCQRLLKYRKRHAALTTGNIELLALPDPVVAWQRWLGDDRIVAIFNLSPEPVIIPGDVLPRFEPAKELDFVTTPQDGRLCLPPFGVSIGQEHGNRQRR